MCWKSCVMCSYLEGSKQTCVLDRRHSNMCWMSCALIWREASRFRSAAYVFWQECDVKGRPVEPERESHPQRETWERAVWTQVPRDYHTASQHMHVYFPCQPLSLRELAWIASLGGGAHTHTHTHTHTHIHKLTHKHTHTRTQTTDSV